jgi:hypothetical protein
MGGLEDDCIEDLNENQASNKEMVTLARECEYSVFHDHTDVLIDLNGSKLMKVA